MAGWKRFAVTAGIALAAVAASTTSSAQRAPIVDGNLWMNSSGELRRAFLIGAGNMIALESAYAKKKGTPPPPVGSLAAKAVESLTLDDIAGRVTRWYEANPGRRDLPVMAVIWREIVEPGSRK